MSDNDFIWPNLDDFIRRGDAMDAVETEENLMGAMDSLWDGAFRRTKRAAVRVIAGVPAVPHEMTAREFVEGFSRMCHTTHQCDKCPFFIEADKEKPVKSCWFWVRDNCEKAVPIVEQWAIEHPEKKRKTYAEDFFEKFPKAEPKYYDGRGKKQMIPIPCRQHCYGVVGQKCNGIGCSCSACWNEEMEGEDE